MCFRWLDILIMHSDILFEVSNPIWVSRFLFHLPCDELASTLIYLKLMCPISVLCSTRGIYVSFDICSSIFLPSDYIISLQLRCYTSSFYIFITSSFNNRHNVSISRGGHDCFSIVLCDPIAYLARPLISHMPPPHHSTAHSNFLNFTNSNNIAAHSMPAHE